MGAFIGCWHEYRHSVVHGFQPLKSLGKGSLRK